jgi:hypothetical protein
MTTTMATAMTTRLTYLTVSLFPLSLTSEGLSNKNNNKNNNNNYNNKYLLNSFFVSPVIDIPSDDDRSQVGQPLSHQPTDA